MPLSPEQRQLKKRIYQALRDKPLEPNDERYIPLYKIIGCDDPIDRLREHIELTDFNSIQFFSGFRGLGKTTELFRLKQELEGNGYFVVYADALEYINEAEAIDITDLLMIIAGAFSDAIEKNENVKKDLKGESYWTRAYNYLLKTDVQIKEIDAKSSLGLIGLAGAEAGLKLELKNTPSFRHKLQQILANRIGELKNEVDGFFEDGVKAVKSALSEETQIVFIFDQLEQLRGSRFNEDEVIRSVVKVFSQHKDKLELPYVHAIYTVPPWLQFAMPRRLGKVVQLQCVKQWDKGEKPRKSHTEGKKLLRKFILKRFGEDGYREFFGEDWNAEKTRADRLIDLSGGHFRDLLYLLREAVLPTNEFPVTDKILEDAISNVRESFLPIPKEDARWLGEIEATNSEALPSSDDESIKTLMRFMDNHWVINFHNGEDWYDIHPIIHDEVRKKIEQLEEDKE
jgi:hypothetical protein